MRTEISIVLEPLKNIQILSLINSILNSIPDTVKTRSMHNRAKHCDSDQIGIIETFIVWIIFLLCFSARSLSFN